MVAHTGSCRNVSTSTARPPTSAVAPRIRPLRTTSRNRAAGDDGKARIRRRLKVRRKMEALRRLVPSGGDGEGADEGRRLDVDELLFRAFDYIVRLRLRLQVMHLMVDVLESTKD